MGALWAHRQVLIMADTQRNLPEGRKGNRSQVFPMHFACNSVLVCTWQLLKAECTNRHSFPKCDDQSPLYVTDLKARAAQKKNMASTLALTLEFAMNGHIPFLF